MSVSLALQNVKTYAAKMSEIGTETDADGCYLWPCEFTPQVADAMRLMVFADTARVDIPLPSEAKHYSFPRRFGTYSGAWTELMRVDNVRILVRPNA